MVEITQPGGGMSVIPALRLRRKEGHEFEASLDCTAKPCLKQNKTKKRI
jgi:hypothetical protein